MNFKLFTGEVKEQWVETGYNYVKLSFSEDIFIEHKSDVPFTLIEPYLNDDEALESDRVVSISSPELEKIIKEKSGRYKQ